MNRFISYMNDFYTKPKRHIMNKQYTTWRRRKTKLIKSTTMNILMAFYNTTLVSSNKKVHDFYLTIHHLHNHLIILVVKIPKISWNLYKPNDGDNVSLTHNITWTRILSHVPNLFAWYHVWWLWPMTHNCGVSNKR